jgi:hypothetical protein
MGSQAAMLTPMPYAGGQVTPVYTTDSARGCYLIVRRSNGGRIYRLSFLPSSRFARLDQLDAANLAVGEADFDAVWVKGGVGEDILDDAARQPAGALIGLEDDGDGEAGMDVFAILSICHVGWSFYAEQKIGWTGGAGLGFEWLVCRGMIYRASKLIAAWISR